MNARRTVRLLLACCASLAVAQGAAAACVARSGAQRAVLLELYTSEGCDSCPPADRRLSQMRSQAEYAGRVVPLAFHVDYWDRLGWVDRFASPRHTRRQYEMAGLARSRLVYTPQFLRNGRDWRSAGSPLDAVAELSSRASIVLELGAPSGGQLAVDGEIAASNAAAEAWLALYENNLESQVRAGENAGKTLRHDYVVRRLIGPLALGGDGRLALRQQIALDPGWKPADLGVVAFVQDKASGEIVQALQRHACGI
ncbi:MAG: hypothetical protein A3H93_11115 [Rhodocyclales bacterium RIFCSPLOWO2_02_FULL_63_24]|nr:MAG: hypothetical protein A2040_15615 [Rhodocyclales bacterium GWA2_65_19]OHC71829.1 MAG: hypothetical protein A3H93_11115 [Rhodocyclales bacterium RIFCSPLOWO2_02_FULL_63_24]